MKWEYIKEHDVYVLNTPIGSFNIYNIGGDMHIEFKRNYIGRESSIEEAKEFCMQYLSLKLEELKSFLKLQDKT